MTNKAKHKAIGKIAKVLWLEDNPVDRDLHYWMRVNVHEASSYTDKAQAVIEALNLEFVDDDTEVEKGDLAVANTHPFRFDGIDNNDETNGLFYSHLGAMYFKYMHVKIIQRNGKPTINVDEMEV